MHWKDTLFWWLLIGSIVENVMPHNFLLAGFIFSCHSSWKASPLPISYNYCFKINHFTPSGHMVRIVPK